MTSNLADFLEASAARYADRMAVVDSAGARATYADLNRQADDLAAFLSDRGVGRGDRVGIVLPKGIAAVAAMFGIMKTGAAYVPVDAAAPVERGRRILSGCQIRALFVDAHRLSVAPESPLAAIVVSGRTPSPSVPSLSSSTPFDQALEAGRQLRRRPAASRDASDLAYILHTSGSTGSPKGAMITQGNALSFIDWCSSEFRPGPDDRFGNHSPLHFDPSVQDIYLAIRHGATVYLISDELGRSPQALASFITDNALTVWCSTPSILTMLVKFGDLDEHDSSSLRLVLFGGEVFPVRHLRELRRRWRSAVFYNLYGPTETTTTCTFSRIPPVVPEGRETPYPIGRPCSHCRALVLDDRGQEVGPGGEGLLHISGPSVFAGYWNRPDATAAAFVERDGVRWYNTGDVVRTDPVEGLFFVGRRDRMVKRRGYRIELDEIEHALHSHESIHEAAVVAASDPEVGVRIVAFVSCRSAQRPSVVSLKTFLASKVPAYMSPDAFIFQEPLPRTSTDKVDYQALLGRVPGVPGPLVPARG
jgi:amino acid adenylation domain-containing protein